MRQGDWDDASRDLDEAKRDVKQAVWETKRDIKQAVWEARHSMKQDEWKDISKSLERAGKDIEQAVKEALQSEEFRNLKDSVKSAVKMPMQGAMPPQYQRAPRPGRARSQGRQGPAPRQISPQPEETVQWVTTRAELQKRPATPDSLASVLLIVFGSIGVGTFSILFLSFLAAALANGSLGLGIVGAVLAPFCAGSAAMLAGGLSMNGRIKRFRLYQKIIGSGTFCTIQALADGVGRSAQYVIRDLSKMIRRKFFPGAHFDEKLTCLMLDDETYQQYLEAEHSMEQRTQAEEERKSDPLVAAIYGMQQDRDRYMKEIRDANDAIPGEDVSQKLTRLEGIISKIFGYVEKHPNKLPEIRKFMSYYLPTTLKLVKRYQDFDQQSVQGETVQAAKGEICKTLDTINNAFDNLLDSLFEDDALDVSTDISVLETMLAQEGLTSRDFKQASHKDENEGGTLQ